VAQFFPADSRSLSLQNAGSVRTNRTGRYCIQVETVFTAGETVGGKVYATVRDTPCKGLDQIMAWLRSLGIPDVWPGGAPTAFARDTVSIDTWTSNGGHYGHNQIPGNSHVDPGPMPALFTTTPPQEDDVALTTDDIAKIATATANKLIAGDGVLENSDVTRVAAAVVAKLQPIEAAQSATIDKLVGAVATLAANIGGLDPAAIVVELKQAIEAISIHLDVPDA
jgi:hypothetical protein